ncbi:NUDIX hydrolase [Euzebya tangerina]|uniref:NUDIX hydrolase n=1 Tax=Euzebya tangerina TaxID=591198 RepID=UPI000E31EBE0|nr:NUDIX hydrolase [Euzebya tangerina]
MPSLNDVTPDQAVATRDAATIVLLRDTDEGPEVLLLRRHARSGFAASLWVFPGGVVDRADAHLDPAHWTGIDPESLTDRFDMPAETVLGMYVAGVRETFEEAGVLLAHHRDGRTPDTTTPAFTRMRAQMNDRAVDADWAGFLREHDLVLDLDALTYLSRWITPIQEPRRYDTCFFVAHLPEGATASADNVETTEERWIRPADAIAADDVPMIFPTIRTLRDLQHAPTASAAVSAAATQPEVMVVQPHMELDARGSFVRILTASDADFPHELYESDGPSS